MQMRRLIALSTVTLLTVWGTAALGFAPEPDSGALEIQLRDAGVVRPIDRRELRESPSAVARALELIEEAAHDDALLEALAPDELAAAVDPSERVAYLRELLSDLPEELIERSFEPAEL